MNKVDKNRPVSSIRHNAQGDWSRVRLNASHSLVTTSNLGHKKVRPLCA
jgi:hypothetical protein